MRRRRSCRVFRIVVLCTTLLLGTAETAQARDESDLPVVVFTDGGEELHIDDDLESFVDPAGRLDIEAVRHAAFRPFAGFPGYASGAFWYRTKIRNAGATDDLVMEIAYPVLDRIEVYAFAEDGGTVVARRAGDALPFTEREFHHRNFAFSLPVPRQSSVTIYLRVETNSSVQVPIVLHSREGFHRYRQTGDAALAFYYGGMIVIAAYNLFLYFALRARSHLLYVALTLSLVFVLSVQNGVAYQYLWPSAVWWNNRAQALSVLVAAVCALSFCRAFLGLRSVLPRLDLIIRAVIALWAVASVASLYINLRTGLAVASAAALTTAGFGIGAGIAAAWKRRRAARFYLLASAVLLLFIVPMALRNFGLLPHSFLTTYGLHIGSLLDVTLLSFALADRINIITSEREQAQARATQLELRAAREREALIADFHDHLGSNLTDIHVLARRLYDEQPASTSITEIAERSKALMHNFHDALSAGDDLRELEDDFIEGLRLILLRRYARVDRPLLFEAPSETARSLDGAEDALLRCLYAVCRELVTNDLKYGAGLAEWRLQIVADSQLELRCAADTAQDTETNPGSGRGLENIRARLAEFGGELRVHRRDRRHEVMVRLPLHAPLQNTPRS